MTVFEEYQARLRLLNLFRAGRLSVDQIVEITRWPRSAVSKHLAFLCAQKLITMEQEPHRIFFRFQDEASKQLRVHLEALDDERDPIFQSDIDEVKKPQKRGPKQKRKICERVEGMLAR
jgi:hypothetical protein